MRRNSRRTTSLYSSMSNGYRTALCWLVTLIMSTGGSFSFGISRTAAAGTPLSVTSAGKEVTWGAGATVTYQCDLGPLGTLTNAQAVAMVDQLFNTWKAVPTANLNVQNTGFLPVDVNSTNYTTYRTNNGSDSYHPVIFDNDGSITDSVFGVGASDFTAGFAGPGWVIGGPQDGTIVDASAVLNAKFLTSGYGSQVEFKAIILHELGHFLGVGHSQVNIGNAYDREVLFNNNATLPIMFPISLGDRPSVLTQDDQAQITRLYPGPGAANMGTIKGQILLPDGVTPFQGANVIARRVDDPTNIAVSSVSGFLYLGTGSNAGRGTSDPTKQGYYEISGLPAGNYTVEVEPVHPGFISGSSVGPLDPPVDLPGPSEYYSGPSESNHDGSNTAAVVSVSTGQVVSNINIILNNTTIPTTAEVEPNNNQASAGTITLPTIVTGNASSTDAGTTEPTTGESVKDFFSFNASSNDWVTFDLTWTNPNAQLTLYLYDSTPQRIAFSMPCLYGSGCVSRHQIGPMKMPSTGKFTIGVGSNSGATPYSLSITSQYNLNDTATTVNGANFLQGAAMAPNTIASMFGVNLASGTQAATPGQALPTTMAGSYVLVDGIQASLFYVSPSQINFLIPSSVATGTKGVVVRNAQGELARGNIDISPISPAFFTANQNGAGVPAGYITRVAAGSLAQTNEAIATWNGSTYVPVTIQRKSDQVYLILFGTGIRNAANTNLANDIPQGNGTSIPNVAESVQVTIGGVNCQVDYAGPQGAFFGLDQINVLIPASAVASPNTSIVIKVRDANNNVSTSNSMTISLQ